MEAISYDKNLMKFEEHVLLLEHPIHCVTYNIQIENILLFL